jgi:hypothetical protein
VIAAAGPVNAGLASKQATNQNFRPEWVMDGYAANDTMLLTRATWDLTQANALYGLRTITPQPPLEKSDSWSLYRWEHGHDPRAKLYNFTLLPTWLNVAAGIHLAGPRLTPLSFRDGLLHLPPYGGSYYGAVSSPAKSFGNRGIWPWESGAYFDNTSVEDTTFSWWNNAITGPDEVGNRGPGMFMFVDGAKRFRYGELPTGEPQYFDPANSFAEISELGPNDRPPSYPNKPGCADRQACWSS